jgi:glycosyltransferase involved in cell wall biosynthesis
MAPLPDYAVITPVKDEGAHLRRTAEAMIAQTHRPRRWIIVDDGSSDESFEIASAYAAEHEWVTAISSGSVRRRERGGPIVEAFNRGLAELGEEPEFVVKLDGDLFLPSHYFAWVAATFAADPRAGVVGGLVLINDGGEWVGERMDRRTVHGAIKSYRSACLREIGGLEASMGWDGIDEYAARARDWKVIVLSELHVLHYKARGSAQPWARARWEEGRGAHYMGYRWRAVLLRAGYRMLVEQPPLLGGVALGLGYLWSAIRHGPQADPRARAQLRREQRGMVRARLDRRGTAEPLPGGGPAYWESALRSVAELEGPGAGIG